MFLPAILLGFLIAGCGHDAAAGPDGDADLQQSLAYADCMRSSGVPNFPDPVGNGNGVEVSVPKGVDEADLAKAEEACRDKLPQGVAEDQDGGGVDSAELADWTKCMRAKLPTFPDPTVSGNTITVTLKGTGIRSDSAEYEKARKSCESHSPGGSLRTVGEQ
ncbi:hypothetical protein [Paractinoplanes toevensis]|uniref:Uncharacterized protein n=1 Tax=Paractinoplanes toevensis TaxID=571911 RepID=A0A919T4T6_9ACTN|nr:hypothetical protein [Actinoplanes toevensis]GIM89213.1 hypothetical protein Ato02nite_010060 [Actinoplanes toevensis]